MVVKAISIRRPWPWAIFCLPDWLAKDVENRDWSTFRGSVLIHSASGCTRDEYYSGIDFISRACRERGFSRMAY